MTTIRPVIPRPSDVRRRLREVVHGRLGRISAVRDLAGRLRGRSDLVNRDLATLLGAVLAASTGIAMLLLLCGLVLAAVLMPALHDSLGVLAVGV